MEREIDWHYRYWGGNWLVIRSIRRTSKAGRVAKVGDYYWKMNPGYIEPTYQSMRLSVGQTDLAIVPIKAS
jgi:hypothetical protein